MPGLGFPVATRRLRRRCEIGSLAHKDLYFAAGRTLPISQRYFVHLQARCVADVAWGHFDSGRSRISDHGFATSASLLRSSDRSFHACTKTSTNDIRCFDGNGMHSVNVNPIAFMRMCNHIVQARPVLDPSQVLFDGKPLIFSTFT